jgi:NAD(P)-dependent dehydrogenase (short-subunit alcohol dehydrogenase family)
MAAVERATRTAGKQTFARLIFIRGLFRVLMLPRLGANVALTWPDIVRNDIVRRAIEKLQKAMQGKTVLITGANQGIGKATAFALALRGARVVMVARNAEKGRAAVADIEASTGSKNVELMVADLSSLSQVRKLASDFKAKNDRLDVLVNNAGVVVPDRRVTVDGFEETFAINHLAHFLLTRELLDILYASAPARVVNVSSAAHRHARMQWGDLQFTQHRYNQWRAYGQSKLANILFTYELARRIDSRKVSANALHPGVIASGFGQTYGGAMAFLIRLAHPFFASTEEGARTSVHLASAAQVDGVTGKYFSGCAPAKSNAASYCTLSQKKLWALSEDMTGAGARAGQAAADRLPHAPVQPTPEAHPST